MSEGKSETPPPGGDPGRLCAEMIDASNNLQGLPGAGLTQALCMVAAGLFPIAAATLGEGHGGGAGGCQIFTNPPMIVYHLPNCGGLTKLLTPKQLGHVPCVCPQDDPDA